MAAALQLPDDSNHRRSVFELRPMSGGQRPSLASSGHRASLASSGHRASLASGSGSSIPPAFESAEGEDGRRGSLSMGVQGIDPKRMKAHRKVFPRKLALLPGGRRRERSLGERIHIALIDRNASLVGKWLNYSLLLLVLLSCALFVFETTPEARQYTAECKPCAPLKGDAAESGARRTQREDLEDFCRTHNCEPQPHIALFYIQVSCTVVFCVVYAVRLLTSASFPLRSEQHPKLSVLDAGFSLSRGRSFSRAASFTRAGSFVLSRWTAPTFVSSTFKLTHVTLRTRARRVWHFATRPLNIIDLAANISDLVFITTFLTDDNEDSVRLSVLRIVRLGRVLRIFSARAIVKVSKSFERVMMKSVPALMSLCVLTAFAMVICGTLVYYAEQGHWDPKTGMYVRSVYLAPDEPTPFTSVPESFWWVLVTFTSVGYGDMYPTSDLGKAVGVMTMYTGVVLLALPIAVVSTKFVEEFLADQEKRSHKRHIRMLRRKALLTLVRAGSGRLMRRAWNKWVAVVVEEREEEQQVASIVRRTLLEFHNTQRSASLQTDPGAVPSAQGVLGGLVEVRGRAATVGAKLGTPRQRKPAVVGLNSAATSPVDAGANAGAEGGESDSENEAAGRRSKPSTSPEASSSPSPQLPCGPPLLPHPPPPPDSPSNVVVDLSRGGIDDLRREVADLKDMVAQLTALVKHQHHPHPPQQQYGSDQQQQQQRPRRTRVVPALPKREGFNADDEDEGGEEGSEEDVGQEEEQSEEDDSDEDKGFRLPHVEDREVVVDEHGTDGEEASGWL